MRETFLSKVLQKAAATWLMLIMNHVFVNIFQLKTRNKQQRVPLIPSFCFQIALVLKFPFFFYFLYELPLVCKLSALSIPATAVRIF